MLASHPQGSVRDDRHKPLLEFLHLPLQNVGQEGQGVHQSDYPHAVLRFLLGKTLLGQTDADLLLQGRPASRRIHNTGNRQAVDLLAHSRQHEDQGVHDEAWGHARAQNRNAVFLGHFIQFAGLVGVSVMRVEQLLSGGDNIDPALHQGL